MCWAWNISPYQDILIVTTVEGMVNGMTNRTGYLTIYSADRQVIYGEFADGEWLIEVTQQGDNSVFTGTASDGTWQTFLDLDRNGISHVGYTFDTEGESFTGDAEFLAPLSNELTVPHQMRFEARDSPILDPLGKQRQLEAN